MVLGITIPPSKCVSTFGKGRVFVLGKSWFQVMGLFWTHYPIGSGWQHFSLVLGEHRLLVPWGFKSYSCIIFRDFLVGNSDHPFNKEIFPD